MERELRKKTGGSVVKKRKKPKKEFRLAAIVCYLLAALMLYKGYDKMCNYVNSEYSTRYNVNAYVGGDAYNYIINGTYSTGFFVLSAGFMTSGTLFLTAGALLNARRKGESEGQDAAVTPETQSPAMPGPERDGEADAHGSDN